MKLHSINLRFALVSWSLFLLVITPCPALEGKQDKAPSTAIKNSILPNAPKDAPRLSFPKDEEDVNGCRDISLHKCGSSMIRVFKLLEFLPWKKAFEAKCTLRKAFFTCMKSEDKPCLKQHWKFSGSTKFRKKVVWALWTTRECVLGLKPDKKRLP